MPAGGPSGSTDVTGFTPVTVEEKEELLTAM
jgi:hypothetical protein